nr:amino acid ABC transporter permease [Klebsiella pneumoniae]
MPILVGHRTVIKLSLLTWGCSIVLGFILALAKQSPRGWLSTPARLYIWLFRSMPLLVLLILSTTCRRRCPPSPRC